MRSRPRDIAGNAHRDARMTARMMLSSCLIMLAAGIMLGCTRIENINFDLSKSEVINSTRIEADAENDTEVLRKNLSDLEVKVYPGMNPGNLAPDELTEPYSGNITAGLCTEKVLIGKRSCSSVNETFNITIVNAGFKNITMIFYIMSGSETIANVSNDHILEEKEEASYMIPLGYINYRYGNGGENGLKVNKIYAVPVLSDQGKAMSCSNKNLPIMLEAC